ncbi:MAG TPA: endolytic transglycosylase MltG [Longimicrobium sp.]|nr:endolytic transglycosylase MltG [Longimicrobium sp.]
MKKSLSHSRTFALSHFRILVAALAIVLATAACGGNPSGPPVRVTIPRSSGLNAATDSLAAHDIIGNAGMFKVYARWKGADRRLKPGVYEFRRGTAWDDVIRKLVTGDVVKTRVVIPEGWTLRQIAARLAETAGEPADSVLAALTSEAAVKRTGVPGPTLEGYVYPATYVFPLGTGVDRMVGEMVRNYKAAWTPEMRQRAQALGMSEREIVTLASIVEREAKVWSERPTISAVYHNRLKRGMRLQADPTVQYALGTQRARLLYRDIDSVADSPYNTYRRAGLPPGPIASPSKGAIEAALNPAQVDYLYFVARPNGTHVFTRTLAEHNAAKRASQREARAAAPRAR